jgi:hypothetical protein
MRFIGKHRLTSNVFRQTDGQNLTNTGSFPIVSSESSKSERPDRSTRICSNRPHLLPQFRFKSIRLAFFNPSRREKRVRRCSSSIGSRQFQAPARLPLVSNHILGSFYGSRGVSRQPTPGMFFRSEPLWFQFLCKDNEGGYLREKGQNSKRVDRDAISRKSTREK